MKKKCCCLLVLVTLASGNVHAQSSADIQLANLIAGKLKDTLALSVDQRESIYAINLALSLQKSNVRQMHNHPDSLRVNLQRVESARDSLYYPVLGEEKYQLYRQKKTALISNH